MRFHSMALLTGATAVAAGNTANLLLPGFESQDLQAGIVDSNRDTTTYKITCPQTVAADACGIAGDGMTAVAAPTAMELRNINVKGTTGTLSCDIAGTTYAFCHASAGTATPSGTLDAGDLNWMPVTISTHSSTSTPTLTSTSTTTPTTTGVATTATPSSTGKKSSGIASSIPLISSTPLVGTPTGSVSSGTGAPAASSTAYNAADQVTGSLWTVSGALMALACVFV